MRAEISCARSSGADVKLSCPPILDRLGKGPPVRIDRVGGGCISDAQVAEFADGTGAFVKCRQGVPGMFECEASGLRALAGTGVIRVPQVLAVSDDALVLEWIRAAPKCRGFFEAFGRAFARLHQFRGPAAGFVHDNFIGLTLQPNSPLCGDWGVVSDSQSTAGAGSDWPEFFLQRRLRFQVQLAAQRGYGHELARMLDNAEPRITELLEEAIEPLSLLHGDLWGGNYIVDERGEACLIDPAVYYGHREADLAMTRLFGGFEGSFYAAYQEALPLAGGHEDRLPVYQLYHLLNHLNLFGRSYHSQCVRILRSWSTGPA
jgi:protein-ribulosamine 3-kinase